MHFTAMLALNINVIVFHNVFETILSLFAAITSSFIAFYSVTYFPFKKSTLILSAFFMGMGIFSMHYVGMHAMRLDAIVKHDYFYVGFSVIIVILISLPSLFLFFRFMKVSDSVYRLPSAVVMGGRLAACTSPE